MSDDARKLYARSYQGILSTLSVKLGGYPFGSVVTYATDADAQPVILISRIAEHTRNVDADPRVSLTLTEPGDDGQALARLTLVGDAELIPDEAVEAASARYYARFPHAEDYHRTHDFSFYRIVPRKLRYIGGFGRIHWLEADAVLKRSPFTVQQEVHMVSHMNNDHADAIRDYCRLYGESVGDEGVRMSAVDSDGFDLMLGKRLLRIDFETPVSRADEVRKALVDLARRARAPV